jgi:hypothetical protein
LQLQVPKVEVQEIVKQAMAKSVALWQAWLSVRFWHLKSAYFLDFWN